MITTEPAGLEFAQCFGGLGSKVTVLTTLGSVLPRDDPEASSVVTKRLTDEGILIQTGVEILKVEPRGGESLHVSREGDGCRRGDCKRRDSGHCGAGCECRSTEPRSGGNPW